MIGEVELLVDKNQIGEGKASWWSWVVLTELAKSCVGGDESC